MVFCVNLLFNADYSYVKAQTGIATHGEIACGLLCSCLFVLPRLYRHLAAIPPYGSEEYYRRKSDRLTQPTGEMISTELMTEEEGRRRKKSAGGQGGWGGNSSQLGTGRGGSLAKEMREWKRAMGDAGEWDGKAKGGEGKRGPMNSLPSPRRFDESKAESDASRSQVSGQGATWLRFDG